MKAEACGFRLTIDTWNYEESVGDRGIGLRTELPAGTLPGEWDVTVTCGPRGVVVQVLDASAPADFASMLDARAYYLSARWEDIPTDPTRDDSDLRDTLIAAIWALIRPLISTPADV